MAITSARMQQKRGEEVNFDPDKMLPGEWAVSLDTKYVRMCFSPGVCVRMATYEAFEADMAQITAILEEAKTVQEAVEKINLEISDKLNAVIEYSEQTKQYRDEAEQFRNEAFSATPDGYEKLVKNVTENTVKIDTIIEKAELNIKNTASGENIHLTDSANSKVVEFGLYGKATQDGEPTPDAPIAIEVAGSDGSVEVVSCGKNLLPTTKSTVSSEVTFTVNDDGSVIANGTNSSTGNAVLEYPNIYNIKPENEYILTGLTEEGSNKTFRIRYIFHYSDGTSSGWNYLSSKNGVKFVIDKNVVYMRVHVIIASGYTVNNLMFYPMLRLAPDTDDTYESYKETVSTIPTPNGLAGIKVTSGGNYTDENGQQWICDEIVKYSDGTGKRIQRIGKIILDGDEAFTTPVELTNVVRTSLSLPNPGSGITMPSYCDRFLWDSSSGSFSKDYEHFYPGTNTLFLFLNKDRLDSIDKSGVQAYFSSNNTNVYYALAEPIITDLTAEEIAEIEKLHTFYPITNISNDADCGMALTYITDSKLYIDNQLAIQKAQQEEALVTMLLLMPEEVQASMIENDTNNLLNESEV